MGRINKALHEMYDKCHTWDVFEIMKKSGITYIHEQSLPKGIRGITTSYETMTVCIIDKDIHTDKEESRIAHELGHIFLRHNPTGDFENEISTADGENRMEYEANQFAICVRLKCFNAVEYEDSPWYHGNYKVISDVPGMVYGQEPIMEDDKSVPNVYGCCLTSNLTNVNSDAEQIRLDELYKTGSGVNAVLSDNEYQLIKYFRQLSSEQQDLIFSHIPHVE